jgi:hypothetical protein
MVGATGCQIAQAYLRITQEARFRQANAMAKQFPSAVQRLYLYQVVILRMLLHGKVYPGRR